MSKLGRFSLPGEKACAPATIEVTSYNGGELTYIYEGRTDTSLTSHTYTDPGTYQIVQITSLDVPIKTDTLLLEVVESRPPVFSVFKCSGTEVQIEITDEYYDFYVVKFTNIDSAVVAASDPPPTFDFGYPAGNVQVTGHFTNAYANCGDAWLTFSLTQPVAAQVTSANVSEGCEGEFFVDLLITADPYTRYEVLFQQGGSDQTIYTGSFSQTQNTYAVDFDPDQASYCVRVNALNACSGAITHSTESCYTLDLSTLRPLQNAYATYAGNDIQLRIGPSSGSDFFIARRYGSTGEFAFLQTSRDSYTDQAPGHFRQLQYQVSQQDTCGAMLDRAVIAAPYLKITDKNRLTNELEVSLEEPVNQLTDYASTLVIFNSDSSAATELPFETTFVAPPAIGDKLNIVARLDYTSGISIFSNKVTTSYETIVYIPKAFTPNGDGQNDYLELFGLPTDEFELTVYNRWGEAVHQSSGENPAWDGKIDQNNAQEGTYRYKLIFTLPDGKLKTQVGTFVVLEK